MQMDGCLYIIVSNHSFDCVYAIKIYHFEQLKFIRQEVVRKSTKYLTSVDTYSDVAPAVQ